MLHGICIVVLAEERDIVEQDESCEVYCQPCRVVVLLCHGLQLVEHLPSPFRLQLANQDQFDLGSHHRRQRDLSLDRTRLVHDVGVHAEALLAHDQRRLGRHADGHPQPEGLGQQIPLFGVSRRVKHQLQGESVCAPNQLVLIAHDIAAALLQLRCDVVMVYRLGLVKVHNGEGWDPDALLGPVVHPAPFKPVAILRDEFANSKLHGSRTIAFRHTEPSDLG